MKQYFYKIYPQESVHSIVAEDIRDALGRITKLNKCSERRIDLIETKPVNFEESPSKKNYRRFKKGKR